jgi:hypothetical protein
MAFYGSRKRRGRYLMFLAVYLLIVIAGAVALWLLIPDDVKQAIRDTYVNPP